MTFLGCKKKEDSALPGGSAVAHLPIQVPAATPPHTRISITSSEPRFHPNQTPTRRSSTNLLKQSFYPGIASASKPNHTSSQIKTPAIPHTAKTMPKSEMAAKATFSLVGIRFQHCRHGRAPATAHPGLLLTIACGEPGAVSGIFESWSEIREACGTTSQIVVELLHALTVLSCSWKGESDAIHTCGLLEMDIGRVYDVGYISPRRQQ